MAALHGQMDSCRVRFTEGLAEPRSPKYSFLPVLRRQQFLIGVVFDLQRGAYTLAHPQVSTVCRLCVTISVAHRTTVWLLCCAQGAGRHFSRPCRALYVALVDAELVELSRAPAHGLLLLLLLLCSSVTSIDSAIHGPGTVEYS